MKKIRFFSRDKISKLPKSSGVYVFKKDRKFLYIGKASNLKERVKNHFSQPAYRGGLFINQVSKVGFIKTDSEIEALILEANLIKKYQPKYNVIWRDDKNYFYVGITKEEFPRIFMTHQPKLKSKKIPSSPPSFSLRENSVINYIGPFVDGTSLKQTLKVLRKVFPYRTCKTLPKHPCLWYQLGRCPAPCLIKLEIPGFKEKIKAEIQRNAKNLMKILQGKKNQALKNLKKEMKKASNSEDYEKAAKIRDQIRALEKVLAHAKIFEIEALQKKDWPQIQKILQKVLKTKKTTTHPPPSPKEAPISRIEAYDISNIQGQEATGSLVTFVRGLPDKNFYRKFKIKIAGKPNDIAMIKEVLKRRLKHLEWGLPDLILIDGGRAQLNAVCQCLTPEVKQIKVTALAKGKNKLFIEGRKRPILLKTLPKEIFNLILELRDEAHRFAISYHRKLREIDLRQQN
jgi:excinuclease ABC subunit C